LEVNLIKPAISKIGTDKIRTKQKERIRSNSLFINAINALNLKHLNVKAFF